MRLGRFILCALATSALLCSELALAVTKTWVGPFSGGNWSTGPNWSPSGVPVAGDTVVFNSTTISNADLGAVALGAIVFGPTFGGSVINGAVTINGLAATYNIDDQNTTATANTINATIALTGTTAYFRAQSATRTLKLNGVISGNFGVRVYGPGSVDFSGQFDNTYTGATTVMPQGTLLLSGLGFKLVPADLFIGDGTGAANSAKVRLTSNFSDLIADTAKVTIASDGQLDMGIRSDTIAQLTGTGSVTMSSTNTLTVGDTGNFTWGGVISGTGNVNKVGTGTMTYTAANTYTGLTTVSNGTLVLNAGDTIQAIQGPLTIGDGIGAANTAIVQIANWFQIDSNSLALTINSDGKLENGLSRDDLGAVTLNGGNIVLGAQYLRVLGGLTMNGGTITATGGGELWMASNVVATSTAPFGAASINATVAPQTSSIAFTVNSGSTQPELTINGAVILRSPPSLNLVKTGAGTLRLAGTTANTYGGSTTIEQGVLELAKPDNVTAITGPIVIGNNTDAAGSATLRNLATLQIGGKPSVTINASGVYDMNSAVLFDRREWIGGLSGTGLLLMPGSSNLIIEIPSGSATFAGTLSSQTSITSLIEKIGVGEQIFIGNGSAHVASVSVAPGRLTVNSPGVLGSLVESRNGGEVGGTGQIGRLIAYGGGSVRPGNGSGGALSVGTTRFIAGSTLVIDLAIPTFGGTGELAVNGTVTIDPGAVLDLRAQQTYTPSEGTFALLINNDGTDAIRGTFLGLPEGRTVPVGLRNMTISYADIGNDATLTARNTLDIDGDSRYLADTDGLLIARHINNLSGAALGTNAVAPANIAKRTDNTDMKAYLTHLGTALDVDQSGGAPNTTDTVLILRYLFGFRDAALVNGLPIPNGQNAATITQRLLALTP